MSHASKPMKAIIYGPSSRSYDSSYLILRQQNMFTNATSTESKGAYLSQTITKMTDRLTFAFNYFALSIIKSDSKRAIDISHLLDDNEIENFFMDNTMSTASYKKILLMLLYFGKIDDVTSWSRKTHTIFHKWTYRSTKIEEKYEGDYSLKLQLGEVVLQVIYNSALSEIKMAVNKLSNLVFLKELIERAIELSGMDKDRFLRSNAKGSFLLTHDTVVTLPNENGIHISTMSLQSLRYRAEGVVYANGFFTLKDVEGHTILQTIEGLLSTDYIPHDDEIKEDISLHGISFRKLTKLRPFNTYFSVEHISPEDLMDLLKIGQHAVIDDLIVPPPVVTDVTNERLGTHYNTRNLEFEFSDIKLEESTPDELDDTMQMQDDDLYNIILNPSASLLDSLKQEGESTNFHELWLNPEFDLSLLRTMTKQIITYQPKKILERTINIKYQIIASLVTNVNIINKETIQSVHKLLQNKHITYSLIYAYDKQYSNKDAPSPTGFELRVHSLFQVVYCSGPKLSLDI